jgi:hypothetical protein
LTPHILSARNPEPALQLYVPSARLDLSRRLDQSLNLLGGGNEVREQGRCLRRTQSHRRIGTGELDQEPGAIRHQAHGIMSEPCAPGALRRLVEVAAGSAALAPKGSWGQGQNQQNQVPMHCASLMNSPKVAAGFDD